jgi:pimeloyl-ACP methyl ester carboxylesterase/DNA-binding CsgD family transcriptional regulator
MGGQEIGFCRTADGTGIAFARSGTGGPLVKTAHFLTHVELDWESPLWGPWWTELGAHHRLVRFDQRGCGLSDRDVDRFDLDAWVADLEAVVEFLGLDRFPLLGMSQGGPVAIAYAARHPERVSHLILHGSYVRGTGLRPGFDPVRVEAMRTLVETGWGQETAAFRRVFATMMVPDASTEQLAWFDELQRNSAEPETAARLIGAFDDLDVREEASSLDVPTLVMHSTGDARVPFEEGRLAAATIPSARLVPLDSRNHILLPDEAAFAQMMHELHAFLGVEARRPRTGGRPAVHPELADLTDREVDVVRLMSSGMRNPDIARRLFLSEKTVRNYVSNIMTKLGTSSRGEVIALAHRIGVVEDEP